jgi:hypothetical protein
MRRPLTPFTLSGGFPLHPDDGADPYAFKVDLSAFGIGTSRVAFAREPGPRTTSFHLDLVMLSFDKQPTIRNLTRWLAGAPAAGAAAAINSRRAKRHREVPP